MVTQTAVQPYNGILLSIKMEELLIQATNWIDFKDIMLSEKAKDNKMYNSIYITLSKYQNYSDREQISSCQGLRLRERHDYIQMVPRLPQVNLTMVQK